MSKRIVLIGGSGFVGTRLIDLFQQKDYEIQNIGDASMRPVPEK